MEEKVNLAFIHETVLLEATVDAIQPRDGGRYIDATLGGGGHTRLLLERSAPTGYVLAFDQDTTAIENARVTLVDMGDRLQTVHANFVHIEQEATNRGFQQVDGILFDLGVSSPQFDVAERGFSYRQDGPLDMRMDRRQRMTAETFVNEAPVETLTNAFFRYGEEKFSRAIARKIVEAREVSRITSTTVLADLIKAAIPAAARRSGPHPARRVFQAIRIAVNDELAVLQTGIEGAFSLLSQGGRLAVISFHSLEDRIVKQTFRDFATGCICPPALPICTCGRTPRGQLVSRKPVEPTEEEQTRNPRARSAKLRVIEKL